MDMISSNYEILVSNKTNTITRIIYKNLKTDAKLKKASMKDYVIFNYLYMKA